MPMRIHRIAHYPASPDDVFAVLSSQEFQDAKVADHGVDPEAEVLTEDGQTLIRTVRTISTEGMPGLARSLVGDVFTIVEEQRWSPVTRQDGAHEGRISIRIKEVAVSLTGTILLTGDDQGSTTTIDAELAARIPLVGRQVEQSSRPSIEASMDEEARLLHAWVDEL